MFEEAVEDPNSGEQKAVPFAPDTWKYDEDIATIVPSKELVDWPL